MNIIAQTSTYELLEFPVHGDHTGSLVALEKGADFPFEIQRVYYVWGTDSQVTRGHHAHKQLEQVIVVTSGSCDFTLDNGQVRETVHLDSPNVGLYIKGNIWRTFTNFSPDCVVMVLASMHYDESDYIRSYEEFLKVKGKGERPRGKGKGQGERGEAKGRDQGQDQGERARGKRKGKEVEK